MNTADFWLKFWGSYRNIEAKCDDDLFFQVGKTVNKNRISSESLIFSVERIREALLLSPDDIMFDLCCGNGLITYELRNFVKKIKAFDFTHHLIEAANELKKSSNIEYFQVSVLEPFDSAIQISEGRPTKFLMNDSLAYFQENELISLIKNINYISGGDFIFLATGVPNASLKNNFYNTPERQKKYQSLLQDGDETNGGLGNWWSPKKIQDIAVGLNIRCNIKNQPSLLSSYRMDIIFFGAKV